jgi:hypothetical protein
MNAPAAASPAIYRAPVVAPAFPPIGGGLRIAFGIVVAIATLGFFGAIVLFTSAIIVNPEQPNEALAISGACSFGVTVLFLYVQIGIGLFWIYRVWDWLPPDQRWSRHWKGWISPSMAAGMMLIPYFHYYWMFVIDCGICDAFDRMRVAHPTSRPAPKNLAIAACICQLIVPMPVGAILWFMLMSRIETMSREMSANASAIAQTGFAPR